MSLRIINLSGALFFTIYGVLLGVIHRNDLEKMEFVERGQTYMREVEAKILQDNQL